MIRFSSLPIAALVLLTGCNFKLGVFDTQSSDTAPPPASDTASVATSDPRVDADGDGVVAAEDCDDAAPWMWQGSEERSGDVELDTPEDVHAFCAGSCTVELDDALTIGPDISDLSTLTCLVRVGGRLSIEENTALRDLSGLDSLASVGGNLYLMDDSALNNLHGLGGLTAIGGNLDVKGDNTLSNLDALGTLSFVGGDLYIHNNPALGSVDALGSLVEVADDVTITSNAPVSTVDVEAMVGQIDLIGGTITVEENGS